MSASASASVQDMSSAEKRIPGADGTAIDDTCTVDERVGSCVAWAIKLLACGRYAHPATAPPPASRPHALLPDSFTPGPWEVSQPTFGGLPASSPNPPLLTSLPLCPSSHLACSSVPFLQRYGAAAVLDADLQLPEQSELALPVTFGILGRQSVLLRAYLAPTLPGRRPDAEAVLLWPLGLMAGQLVPTTWPPDRSVTARRSMTDVADMPRAS